MDEFPADYKKEGLTFDEWLKDSSSILMLVRRLGIQVKEGISEILGVLSYVVTPGEKKLVEAWLNHVCKLRHTLEKAGTYKDKSFTDVVGTITNGKEKKAPEAKPKAKKVVFSGFKAITLTKPKSAEDKKIEQVFIQPFNAVFTSLFGEKFGAGFTVDNSGSLYLKGKKVNGVNLRDGISQKEYLLIIQSLKDNGVTSRPKQYLSRQFFYFLANGGEGNTFLISGGEYANFTKVITLDNLAKAIKQIYKTETAFSRGKEEALQEYMRAERFSIRGNEAVLG